MKLYTLALIFCNFSYKKTRMIISHQPIIYNGIKINKMSLKLNSNN